MNTIHGHSGNYFQKFGMVEMIEETAEEMRARIESRDGRMIEDLRENFSGRTWFASDGGDVND